MQDDNVQFVAGVVNVEDYALFFFKGCEVSFAEGSEFVCDIGVKV